MITVYVSIGNSDDKLTQAEWSNFYTHVSIILRSRRGLLIHGEWVSEPTLAWQNACWCIEVPEEQVEPLRVALKAIAALYRQDSIAWAVAEVEFLTP